MSLTPWLAAKEVVQIMEQVKGTYHSNRLVDLNANVAVCFVDSNPFPKGRLNLGKTSRFSSLARLWQPQGIKYDFCITLCADVWHNIINGMQREALMDLHLERCQVEYVPAIVVENGKKRIARDQWGRIEYTEEIRFDDEGRPKWKLFPFDLPVFSENIKRYGIWCDDILNLKYSIDSYGENDGQ